MARFDGRTIVVTGGGPGIGRETVQRLLKEGAQVSVWDQNVEELRGSDSDRLTLDPIDLTDPQSVYAARDRVLSKTGRLDGLICSAGR